ncbi:MAG: FKBP-type peptidyl-prolyl cis-trans isomerase [Bacteroidales bacterium]|nr:FKBP-type peptidyl-prolyl cis-trans isomerase [Bacteroidales bacterium]MBQ1883330.1 FKBP-type peptidyl-prolyl cis-trans isomerase [Bacteroidales bacterium]MBQ2482150.1 FKBP-type peptidyl-prolyl cis-trans isomerase [Bacteroidales bacterium]MBQ4196704.1 FKBP-type peptidyl-prolyl cis-trans isomerase [Bacteroidales bacterium]
MKIFKTIAVCALSAMLLASCTTTTVKTVPGIPKSTVDSASVAVGVAFANMIKSSQMENLNIEKIKQTIVSVLKGDTVIFNEQTAPMYIQGYIMKMNQAMGEIKRAEEDEFLAKNKTNEGVQESESRLQYKIEVPGNDVKPTLQDTVEVNYKGSLLNGKVFDSSYDRGETVKFPVNGVIPGWQEGVQLIGEGGKVKLWIPFDLAYGSQDMGPDLPAFSTLMFDVELVKVMKFQPKEEKKAGK